MSDVFDDHRILNPDQATALARRLKVIRGYPWDEESVNATAQCLTRWCHGSARGGQLWTADEQARELIAEMIDRAAESGDEWKGIGQLRALFKERFGAPTLDPARQVIDLGPKPVVECALCSDFGTQFVDGRYGWCSCAQAQALQQECPDFVERLNTAQERKPVRGWMSGSSIPSWMSRTDTDRELKSRDRERKRLARRMTGAS